MLLSKCRFRLLTPMLTGIVYFVQLDITIDGIPASERMGLR